MSITFYPKSGDLQTTDLKEKLGLLLGAAEQYKAAILQIAKPADPLDPAKRHVPRDMMYAYNWDELAKLLRELRELPENNQSNRLSKSENLMKLAEVYEVLRGAKMPKLEAVRLALVNEANQLRSTSAA
jgi:hypothetical protein